MMNESKRKTGRKASDKICYVNNNKKIPAGRIFC